MSDLLPVSENASGPTILGDSRERWLSARRQLVTASDAAAILGFAEGRSAISVYAEKLGALTPAEEDWMEWGRDVEVAIAKAFARKAKRPIRDLGAHEIQIHPDIPWLGSTLDQQTHGTEDEPAPIETPAGVWVPMEAKAVAGMKASKWIEEPPLEYQIQVQIQMACTGAQWGSIVALFGGIQVAWRDLLRDDAFLAAALPKLEEFWWRVQRREPPDVLDAKEATTSALRGLYSAEDGSTVELGDEALQLADDWEAARIRADAAETEVATLKNKLVALIGNASFGDLPDGTLLKLPVTNVKGYVRTVQPFSYRKLSRVRPRLPRRSR